MGLLYNQQKRHHNLDGKGVEVINIETNGD